MVDATNSPTGNLLVHSHPLGGGLPGQGKAAPWPAVLDWLVDTIGELDAENAALRAEVTMLDGALADAAWDINALRDQVRAAAADPAGADTARVVA